MATVAKTWGGQALPLDKGSLRTNVIFNDDCIKGMSLMPDESVDLILTDPPYNISVKNNFHTLKGRHGIDFGEWDKGFDFYAPQTFLDNNKWNTRPKDV